MRKCAEELPIPISVSMKCLKCTFFIWCQLQARSQVLFDNQMGNTKGFPSWKRWDVGAGPAPGSQPSLPGAGLRCVQGTQQEQCQLSHPRECQRAAWGSFSMALESQSCSRPFHGSDFKRENESRAPFAWRWSSAGVWFEMLSVSTAPAPRCPINKSGLHLLHWFLHWIKLTRKNRINLFLLAKIYGGNNLYLQEQGAHFLPGAQKCKKDKNVCWFLGQRTENNFTSNMF